MAKRNYFRKCIWIGIVLWIVFCVVKGVYEEMQKMNHDVEVLEMRNNHQEGMTK